MLTVKRFASKVSSIIDAIELAKKLNLELSIGSAELSIICRDGRYILPTVSERHRRRLMAKWNETVDIETKRNVNIVRKAQKEFKIGCATFTNFQKSLNVIQHRTGLTTDKWLQFLKTNYNEQFKKIELVK